MPTPARQQYESALQAILAHYASLGEEACNQVPPTELAHKLALSLGANADRDAEACAASNPARRPLACVQGCTWCCRGTRIDLHAPEVILIADALRGFSQERLLALRQRISQAAQRFRSQSGRELWLAQHPCALLGDDGTCCAYEVRPFVCRTFHSHDALMCERVHRNPAGDESGLIETDASYSTMYGAARMGIVRASDRRGLDTRILEMTNGLEVALSNPEAAERWAGGDKVFELAALPTDPSDEIAKREMEAELRRRVRNARKAGRRAKR